MGKALYEGILLDLALAPPLVMALQGSRPGVDDLAAVDAGLASGLSAVRDYPGDVTDLGLTFSMDIDNFGRVRRQGGLGLVWAREGVVLETQTCGGLNPLVSDVLLNLLFVAQVIYSETRHLWVWKLKTTLRDKPAPA